MSDLADFSLSPSQRELLASLLPVVAPPGEAKRLGVTEAVIEEAELMIRAMPALLRTSLVLGMTTYDQTARLMLRHRRQPARKLEVEDAGRWFEVWRHGLAIQRQFVKGIKGILAMSYCETPEVQEAMGYTPAAWVRKVKQRRLETYQREIDDHEASIFVRDPIPLPSEVDPIPLASGVAGRSEKKHAVEEEPDA